MLAATSVILASVLLFSSLVPQRSTRAVVDDQSSAVSASSSSSRADDASNASNLEQFNLLRRRGNDALYNLDYETAGGLFQQMTKLLPDHPAGYVYLANNFWLETLNQGRRLSSTLYSGGSFYEQDQDQDKVDPKREAAFNGLVRRAIAIAEFRLKKNPNDAESLYFKGAALGLRAGYNVTVKRSFRRAIGDANESIIIQKKVVKIDPEYVDAYLSIGLYDYIVASLPWVWRTLAKLAGVSGSKERGIERLEMVTRNGKYTADDARVLLIGIYTREGRPERALEMITYLANKYPRNYLLGVERAGMLFRMNRPAEGDKGYGELLKDERVAHAAADLVNYQWGEALFAGSEFARAVDRYAEVVKWPKSDQSLVSLAHLRKGQALDALGKREEAIAEYQVVLKRENVFDSHKRAGEFLNKPYAPAKSS